MLLLISAGCAEISRPGPEAFHGCYSVRYSGDPSREGNLEIAAPDVIRLDRAVARTVEGQLRHRLWTRDVPLSDTMTFVPAWTAPHSGWWVEDDSAHIAWGTGYTGLHVVFAQEGAGLRGNGDTYTDFVGNWKGEVQAIPIDCRSVEWKRQADAASGQIDG